MAPLPSRFGSRALWLALLIGAVQLLGFAALDRRPPDDHDDFYTAETAGAVAALDEVGLFPALGEHLTTGDLHPGLARTSLLATLAITGPSRGAFRAANLPWLLLLIGGTWVLARGVGGPRAADAAALVIATLPIVIQCSRKWDIQFHAAALTPLAWALGLAALRRSGRQGVAAWLALAVVQTLRLHTHPIVAPDVAALYGLLLLGLIPSARHHGVAAGSRLGHWLGSLLACGFASGWYLGAAPALFGEAPHSLRRYLSERGSYMGESWWSTAGLSDQVGLLVELASDTVWIHAFPVAAAVGLGGLILLARGRAPGQRDPVGLALLAAGVAGQLPPILLGTSNLAFLNDWLFVVPAVVVLAVAGWSDHPARRAAFIAVALQGAWVVVAPASASMFGPPVLQDPGAYDGRLLRGFARGSSGRHHATHHLLVRTPGAADALLDVLPAGRGPARVALHDLSWDPTVGAGARCALGSLDADEAWAWAAPAGQNVSGRPLSPWPFVFAGREGVDLRRPDEDRTEGAEIRVVRLWVRPSKRWESEQNPCWPSERLPDGFLAEAQRRTAQRFDSPGHPVADRPGWLVGRVVEWDRSRAYLGTALTLPGD